MRQQHQLHAQLFDILKIISGLEKIMRYNPGQGLTLEPSSKLIRNPFGGFLENRYPTSLRVSNICNAQGLESFHPVNKTGKIGKLYLEKGISDASSDYPGRYEALKIKLDKPLYCIEELLLPQFTIEVLKVQEEFTTATKDRWDHQRIANIYWARTDLKDKLPNELFEIEDDFNLKPLSHL